MGFFLLLFKSDPYKSGVIVTDLYLCPLLSASGIVYADRLVKSCERTVFDLRDRGRQIKRCVDSAEKGILKCPFSGWNT